MEASAAENGPRRRAVRDARRLLRVRRLALAIHDASLPGDPEEDLGRGAPASEASLRLAAFASAAGFDALQLGPQGLTDESDASPYNGALFSRSPLGIALGRLADPDDDELGGWLPAAQLDALVAARPPGAERCMPYASVFRAQRVALGAAFERFERQRRAGDRGARLLEQRLERFRAEAAGWLEADSLYEVLRSEYGGREWNAWTGPRAELDRRLVDARCDEPAAQARRAELARRYEPALRFYCFAQLLAHAQHEYFRAELARLGLSIFGDLQVGVSPRDTWRHPGSFLAGYRLGAPPSRTNPDGQPWDYPVLDPDASAAVEGGPGEALRFLRARMEKMFAEYDAVRIDHPQGLVCPWVYREDDPDPLRAVKQGARLFSSPACADHPALARFAIARLDQLAGEQEVPRHDDHWVRWLDDAQVDRYARLFDAVVETGRRLGHADPALICEILSTLPHPLARVIARHGLGRFRVTQKADLADPSDGYRPENAEPRDWIMFGNHDTPPLWHLLEVWRTDGRLEARAAAAAARLEPDEALRPALRARLQVEPGLMAHAEMAQLFASPAEHVSIFFSDLFGLKELYNRPGTLSPENWTLRLTPDWHQAYASRLRDDRALNLPLALWLALRARADAPGELVEALREEAERPRTGSPLF